MLKISVSVSQRWKFLITHFRNQYRFKIFIFFMKLHSHITHFFSLKHQFALIRKWVLRSLKEIYLHTNAHICSTNGLCYGLLNKDVKWSIFREYSRVFSVWTNHTFAGWQRDRHSKVAGQILSRTREGKERGGGLWK